MGVVSPVGNDLESFFGNLCAGKSGISAIESFECEDWPTRIAGEVKDFDPGDLISKKMSRRLDRSIKFSLYAGKMALLDAGLPVELKEYAFVATCFEALSVSGRYQVSSGVQSHCLRCVVPVSVFCLENVRAQPNSSTHVCRNSGGVNVQRAGCLVGSAFGGMTAFAGGCSALLTSHRKMNPFCIPFAITNMGSAMLAMDTGLMGPNYSISSACATGNYCMLNAVNHIRAGEADVMLAGATDAAIIPEGAPPVLRSLPSGVACLIQSFVWHFGWVFRQ